MRSSTLVMLMSYFVFVAVVVVRWGALYPGMTLLACVVVGIPNVLLVILANWSPKQPGRPEPLKSTLTPDEDAYWTRVRDAKIQRDAILEAMANMPQEDADRFRNLAQDKIDELTSVISEPR